MLITLFKNDPTEHKDKLQHIIAGTSTFLSLVITSHPVAQSKETVWQHSKKIARR